MVSYYREVLLLIGVGVKTSRSHRSARYLKSFGRMPEGNMHNGQV